MNLRAIIFALMSCGALAWGQAGQGLRLEKTIEMPEVQGRIDHMSLDVNGQRLFVSALGNGSVEVLDMQAATRIKTIRRKSRHLRVAVKTNWEIKVYKRLHLFRTGERFDLTSVLLARHLNPQLLTVLGKKGSLNSQSS